MANKEKARRFFEASRTGDYCGIMVENDLMPVMSFIQANIEEGKEKLIEFLEKTKEALRERVVGMMQGLYEKEFTDEELDEIIAFYESPPMQHLLNFIPMLPSKMEELLFREQETIMKEAKQIYREVYGHDPEEFEDFEDIDDFDDGFQLQ